MSQTKQNESTNARRDFLKLSGLTALIAMVSGKILLPNQAKAADAKLEMVKTSDPMAVSLGYTEDASKVDTKKFPKRAGADGKGQFCYTCQFYQYKGDAKLAKDSKAAPCQILGNKGVKAKAWCNTWTQAPDRKA